MVENEKIKNETTRMEAVKIAEEVIKFLRDQGLDISKDHIREVRQLIEKLKSNSDTADWMDDVIWPLVNNGYTHYWELDRLFNVKEQAKEMKESNKEITNALNKWSNASQVMEISRLIRTEEGDVNGREKEQQQNDDIIRQLIKELESNSKRADKMLDILSIIGHDSAYGDKHYADFSDNELRTMRNLAMEMKDSYKEIIKVLGTEMLSIVLTDALSSLVN